MTNVPGAQGRGAVERKDEDTDAALLFPSEGTFSAVVPLSEVRAGRGSARDSAALAVAPQTPGEPEDEATLVPARARRARLARRASSPQRESRRWLVMTAAVVLSVFAGLAAGAYMVWTQQTRQARQPAEQAADTSLPSADAAAQQQAAPEAPQPAPAPDVAESSEPAAEVVKVERVGSPEASADDAKPAAAKAGARPSAAETASRRDAETEPRARERARASAADSTPAPKPAARREPAPRRQTTPERARTNATASRGRALPVSSPPPSARPRTVIQWP